MVNYGNGKVYKIVSSKTDNVYIGSTTKQLLCQRMDGHRSNFKLYQKGGRTFTTSFDILKYGDATIELIEDFPCKTKDQLHAREAYWIRITPNTVNCCIPGRTDKQWYNDNKDKVSSDMKDYYQAHSDDIKQRVKQYRYKNIDKVNARIKEKLLCVCGLLVQRGNKAVHEKTGKHIAFVGSMILPPWIF